MSIHSHLVAITILLATASTLCPSAVPEHLKVRLVSDTDSVQSGRPLLVGLHFEMDEGWHIYWKNPGDSGEPPRVRWSLPVGFQAAEVQWPAPTRLGSGSVIDYGYEEPVLLPVEIETPEGLAIGSSVTLAASVSWLVCKDICVPGKTDVTLSLPVRTSKGSSSASHQLLQDARSRVPKPLPPAWTAEATSEMDYFVLTIHGVGTGNASFFPLESDQIDNAAPQRMTPLSDGVRLTLKNSDRLLKPPVVLSGVLELGSGRAYLVSAAVHARPR